MNFLPQNSIHNSTKPAGIIPLNPNFQTNSRKFSNHARDEILDINSDHAVIPSHHTENSNSLDQREDDEYNIIPSMYDSSYTSTSIYAAPGGPISSNVNLHEMDDLWNPLNYTDSTKTRKNSTVGKFAIHSDTNLSSSTEDLLSLVNQTHLNGSGQDFTTTSLSELSLKTEENNLRMNNTDSRKPSDPGDILTGKSTCRYYSLGFCNKGSKCSFMHSTCSVDKAESKPVAQSTSRRNSRVHVTSPSKYANMTINDCVNKIFVMCKDQHGCRFLQKMLEEDDTPKACQIIFDEVLPNISDLMSDPFGNYLCQKLIEKCTVEQRTQLIKGVSNSLVKISKNIHGTRAVQKTIELISSPEEVKYVREALKGNVVSLIQDLNGNHVIQKCINKLEPNDNQFIYDAVAHHCIQVSTHRHGCCVMQRCIDHASSQQRRQLIEEITNNALALVQDAFGNYVVQYVLDLGSEDTCEQIAKQLCDSLYHLALQKFSSNVIEKIFKVGNERTVKIMAKQLANYWPKDVRGSVYNNEDPLIPLLQHPFGNYVIQTALHVSSVKAVEEWNIISERIKSNLHNLKRTPYVKKIQSLINQGTSKMSGDVEIS